MDMLCGVQVIATDELAEKLANLKQRLERAEAKLDQDIAELEAVRQALGIRIITCAYCGHEYPPGTPETQHDLLVEHGQCCAYNPIREDLLGLIDMIYSGTHGQLIILASKLARQYHRN